MPPTARGGRRRSESTSAGASSDSNSDDQRKRVLARAKRTAKALPGAFSESDGSSLSDPALHSGLSSSSSGDESDVSTTTGVKNRLALASSKSLPAGFQVAGKGKGKGPPRVRGAGKGKATKSRLTPVFKSDSVGDTDPSTASHAPTTSKASKVAKASKPPKNQASSTSASSAPSKATPPAAKPKKPPKGDSLVDPELYCICRTPYDGKQFMIACDKCEEWFHGKCVKVKATAANKREKYFCAQCVAAGDESTGKLEPQPVVSKKAKPVKVTKASLLKEAREAKKAAKAERAAAVKLAKQTAKKGFAVSVVVSDDDICVLCDGECTCNNEASVDAVPAVAVPAVALSTPGAKVPAKKPTRKGKGESVQDAKDPKKESAVRAGGKLAGKSKAPKVRAVKDEAPAEATSEGLFAQPDSTQMEITVKVEIEPKVANATIFSSDDDGGSDPMEEDPNVALSDGEEEEDVDILDAMDEDPNFVKHEDQDNGVGLAVDSSSAMDLDQRILGWSDSEDEDDADDDDDGDEENDESSSSNDDSSTGSVFDDDEDTSDLEAELASGGLDGKDMQPELDAIEALSREISTSLTSADNMDATEPIGLELDGFLDMGIDLELDASMMDDFPPDMLNSELDFFMDASSTSDFSMALPLTEPLAPSSPIDSKSKVLDPNPIPVPEEDESPTDPITIGPTTISFDIKKTEIGPNGEIVTTTKMMTFQLNGEQREGLARDGGKIGTKRKGSGTAGSSGSLRKTIGKIIHPPPISKAKVGKTPTPLVAKSPQGGLPNTEQPIAQSLIAKPQAPQPVLATAFSFATPSTQPKGNVSKSETTIQSGQQDMLGQAQIQALLQAQTKSGSQFQRQPTVSGQAPVPEPRSQGATAAYAQTKQYSKLTAPHSALSSASAAGEASVPRAQAQNLPAEKPTHLLPQIAIGSAAPVQAKAPIPLARSSQQTHASNGQAIPASAKSQASNPPPKSAALAARPQISTPSATSLELQRLIESVTLKAAQAALKAAAGKGGALGPGVTPGAHMQASLAAATSSLLHQGLFSRGQAGATAGSANPHITNAALAAALASSPHLAANAAILQAGNTSSAVGVVAPRSVSGTRLASSTVGATTCASGVSPSGSLVNTVSSPRTAPTSRRVSEVSTGDSTSAAISRPSNSSPLATSSVPLRPAPSVNPTTSRPTTGQAAYALAANPTMGLPRNFPLDFPKTVEELTKIFNSPNIAAAAAAYIASVAGNTAVQSSATTPSPATQGKPVTGTAANVGAPVNPRGVSPASRARASQSTGPRGAPSYVPQNSAGAQRGPSHQLSTSASAWESASKAPAPATHAPVPARPSLSQPGSSSASGSFPPGSANKPIVGNTTTARHTPNVPRPVSGTFQGVQKPSTAAALHPRPALAHDPPMFTPIHPRPPYIPASSSLSASSAISVAPKLLALASASPQEAVAASLDTVAVTTPATSTTTSTVTSPAAAAATPPAISTATVTPPATSESDNSPITMEDLLDTSLLDLPSTSLSGQVTSSSPSSPLNLSGDNRWRRIPIGAFRRRTEQRSNTRSNGFDGALRESAVSWNETLAVGVSVRAAWDMTPAAASAVRSDTGVVPSSRSTNSSPAVTPQARTHSQNEFGESSGNHKKTKRRKKK
ncbi:hypothetical protein HKX48_002558 [Thoreauomyces humboldtii]|nr:hypothetical protein HKX48_002558 [Thoreauomyces humboldtii]